MPLFGELVSRHQRSNSEDRKTLRSRNQTLHNCDTVYFLLSKVTVESTHGLSLRNISYSGEEPVRQACS
jgi:hypothetical protein